MQERCPDSVYIGIGYIDSYKLQYVGSRPDWFGKAYANIIPAKNCQVWGAVHSLSVSDIKALDHRENAPDDYKRTVMPVYIHNKKINAYVYIVTGMHEKIPSTKYRRIIIKGARERKLPLSYVRAAL